MNFYHWLIQNKNLSKATALKYDLVIKIEVMSGYLVMSYLKTALSLKH